LSSNLSQTRKQTTNPERDISTTRSNCKEQMKKRASQLQRTSERCARAILPVSSCQLTFTTIKADILSLLQKGKLFSLSFEVQKPSLLPSSMTHKPPSQHHVHVPRLRALQRQSQQGRTAPPGAQQARPTRPARRPKLNNDLTDQMMFATNGAVGASTCPAVTANDQKKLRLSSASGDNSDDFSPAAKPASFSSSPFRF
jgi:hypothetical protein